MAGPVTEGGTPISRVQHIGFYQLAVWLAWLCGGIIPAPAVAGAWVPSPQQGLLIANLVDVSSELTPSGASFELYGEYGLTRGWALVASPSWSQAVQSPSTDWVLDEVQIAARRQIYLGQTLAISAQIGGFSVPSTGDENGRSYGLETRFAIGKSLGERAWANFEAASRSCGQGGVGTRFDATLGLKMDKEQKAIVKIFGDGNGCTKAIVRAQIGYVRPITQNLAVELGWRQRLDQGEVTADRGFVAGLWQKF